MSVYRTIGTRSAGFTLRSTSLRFRYDASSSSTRPSRNRSATRASPKHASFVAAAPEAKDFRDFFEHLDEYLLGSGRAQREGRIAGRISPILRLRWGHANVVVDFGGATLDVTAAGAAAVKLAEATGEVWEQCLDKARENR
jgi:hypothetical protein